jgi:hypothetical protein
LPNLFQPDLTVVPNRQPLTEHEQMRNALITVHTGFAKIWLGCILTEAFFERALLPKGDDSPLKLAHLHIRVDKFVELPAIGGVLLTCLLLLHAGSSSGAPFLIMLIVAPVTVAANLVCFRLVRQRSNATGCADWRRFESLDNRQHKVGALMLGALLVGLVTGYFR